MVQRISKRMFNSKERTEKVAKNINDYLAEQQMYRNVDVVTVNDKYVVVIVDYTNR